MFRQKSAGGTVSGLRRWCKGLVSTNPRELIAADMSDLIVARIKKIHEDSIAIKEEKDDERRELLSRASCLTLESNWLELKTMSKLLRASTDVLGGDNSITKMVTCSGMAQLIAKFSNPSYDYIEPRFNAQIRKDKVVAEQLKSAYDEIKEYKARPWLSKFTKVKRAMAKKESQLEVDLRFAIYDAERGVLSPLNMKKRRGILYKLTVQELYVAVYLLNAIQSYLRLNYLSVLSDIVGTIEDFAGHYRFLDDNIGYIVYQDTVNVKVDEFDLAAFDLNKQQVRDLAKKFGINIL